MQHSPRDGVILSSMDLAFQKAKKSRSGNYTCVASNVEGDGESNTVELKLLCKYEIKYLFCTTYRSPYSNISDFCFGVRSQNNFLFT